MIGITAIVAAAALVGASTSCAGERLVGAGLMCLRVPCDYKVVQTHSGVDTASGFVEPRDSSWRIQWLTGKWETLLKPSAQRRILWKRSVQFGDTTTSLGLVEWRSERIYVIGEGAYQMEITASAPHGEALLKKLYVSGQIRTAKETCEAPERSKE